MYRIARNAHMNHLRCQHPDLSLDQQLEDLPDAGDGQDLRLERADHEDLLKVALERLPIGKREVLLLSRRSDLSYKDLAELLECTVGSVKVQVHRALKDLRKTFLALQGGTP
jgi:RNA polymerase sigma-70 factor (ECF subfamily)